MCTNKVLLLVSYKTNARITSFLFLEEDISVIIKPVQLRHIVKAHSCENI